MNIDRIFAELELERSHLSGLGPDDAFQTVMTALRDVEPIGLAWLYTWVLMGGEGAALISRDSSAQVNSLTIDIAKRRLQETLHELRRAEAGK